MDHVTFKLIPLLQVLSAKGKKKAAVFNPDSRLLSRQWRIHTIERLKKILDIYIAKHNTEKEEEKDDVGEVYDVKDIPGVRGPTVTSCIRDSWTSWPKVYL